MTHETDLHEEALQGPEHDHMLPDALSIPVADSPDELTQMTDPDIDWDDD